MVTRPGGFSTTSLQLTHGYPLLSLSHHPGLFNWSNPALPFFGCLHSTLVGVRLPWCLLSIQVPAPSPGYSSSAELPAYLPAPPTVSFGLRSPLPAPSRKCGLSLPSWARRPPAQVSHVY